MNNQELSKKVRAACERQIRTRGYIAPVDILMDTGVLTKAKYEDWRFGRVPYLEQVCNTNLSKLSLMMKEIRSYSSRNGYKESFTYYRRWGAKNRSAVRHTPLRFSKTGTPAIEKAYATHYLCVRRIEELKQQKQKTDTADSEEQQSETRL